MTNYSLELFLLWVVRVVHRTVVTELARRNDGFTPGKTASPKRGVFGDGVRETGDFPARQRSQDLLRPSSPRTKNPVLVSGRSSSSW